MEKTTTVTTGHRRSNATTTTTDVPSQIVQAQLTSLSDTDCYASAWQEALQRANPDCSYVKWGGRGQGGRGLARRTYQPHDIVVDEVRLEYVSENATQTTTNNSKLASGKLLLEGATLKLLAGHVYGLVGRNGVGKSTLLRRIHAKQIPGFPTHVTSLYIPQEGISNYQRFFGKNESSNTTTTTMTPLELALSYYKAFRQDSMLTIQRRTQELEREMERLDMTSEVDAQRMDELCQEASYLEDEEANMRLTMTPTADKEERDDDVIGSNPSRSSASLYDLYHHELIQEAKEALQFFGIDPEQSYQVLSSGQCVKVAMACALFCDCHLLLLDEPMSHLDIHGLLQLRRLIAMKQQQPGSNQVATTILLVSHDVDLVNDVVTDIIHLQHQSLYYYPGNYDNFVTSKDQHELHYARQQQVLEKKHTTMLSSLDHMKHQQPIPKRGGNKKKAKAIESYKKKIERVEMEVKSLTQSNEGVAHDTSPPPSWKLKRGKVVPDAPIDKAVQFAFRNTNCTWGEPLITAMEVWYKQQSPPNLYGVDTAYANESTTTSNIFDNDTSKSTMLLECVDLCLDEGKRIIILGPSACGKSTLLRLLAKVEQPTQGKIQHALNVTVGLLDQHASEKLLEAPSNSDSQALGSMTALTYLAQRFPSKSEQEIRAELKAFGLGPIPASATSIQFLSGGERSRLCYAALMLQDPHVLLLDTPTAHLDIEGVEALIHGLVAWNGTLVVATHDAHFIRSMMNASSENTVECFVMLDRKLFRLRNGLDSYLRSFVMKT